MSFGSGGWGEGWAVKRVKPALECALVVSIITTQMGQIGSDHGVIMHVRGAGRVYVECRLAIILQRIFVVLQRDEPQYRMLRAEA
jgi:hypothetical protein